MLQSVGQERVRHNLVTEQQNRSSNQIKERMKKGDFLLYMFCVLYPCCSLGSSTLEPSNTPLDLSVYKSSSTPAGHVTEEIGSKMSHLQEMGRNK